MQKAIQLKLLPTEAAAETLIRERAAQALGTTLQSITGFHLLRRSLDARSRQVWVMLTILVFVNEPFLSRPPSTISFRTLSKTAKRVVIIGAGPAGLFAALRLLEAGIKPILLERGKDVRARRRDLALLNKEGIVNPESNYCFGEGGAGTYSDGKLYTRSTKRGDINRILNILVQFGAADSILYEAHPHIGTNKLPQIITAIRQQLLAAGAEFHFEKRVTDWSVTTDRIERVICANQEEFLADAVVLATGHSARDIFQLLHDKKLQLEFKDFALGVRVEHPQELINQIQYHGNYLVAAGTPGAREILLPPASYSLVEQVDGRGVFSFCMCPGGIIAPAATAPGELVVNGWSPSKRNNPFANSGMVVTVNEQQAQNSRKPSPLAGMEFQRQVEESAFRAGGGRQQAPAQRITDFVRNKLSADFPACSYLPGIQPASLKEVLPPFIYQSLKQAFVDFGKKMKGYYTDEAVVVATESRTSSPVRIPRHPQALHHPQIMNLYPCGEGAGYAGGIVSAAMDGERVAGQLVSVLT